MERGNGLQSHPDQISEGSEIWRTSQWMLDQAQVIQEAEGAIQAAEANAQAEREKLAVYIRDHTSREVWELLTPKQQEEIISNLPQGSGDYGL